MDETKTKQKRLPRYKVAQVPPPFKMTEQDKQLMSLLYEYRILTTSQIKKKVFDNPQKTEKTIWNATRRRLGKLFHHEFIVRVEKPVLLTVGGEEIAYALLPKGLKEVAKLRGVGVDELDWTKTDKKVSADWLDHKVMISGVRLKIEEQANIHPFHLLRIFGERELDKRQKRYELEQMRMTKIADLYYEIQNLTKNTKAGFFVEVDLGTESIKTTITKKVQAYQYYAHSGMFKEDFGIEKFRVLFIVMSEKRRSNMAKNDTGDSFIFNIATVEEFLQRKFLIDPIWHIMGQNGEAHVLFSLSNV